MLYEFDATQVLTPALVIYPEVVDSNIEAALRMMAGDRNRWRPHVKTVKVQAIMSRLATRGVKQCKCSTTLELRTACQAGMRDVLLAFPVTGANARRTLQIAEEFPGIEISVLAENAKQAGFWLGTKAGIFLDINPGMDRTGIAQDSAADIIAICRIIGKQFRGVHYYDGHLTAASIEERTREAHHGYARLLQIIDALESSGIHVPEVITSGTPTLPCSLSFAGFQNRAFVHRASAGTVVYSDLSSAAQLDESLGFQPAALALATVISHPTPNRFTCDAGHKSVSADAGVPTCAVLGHPEWTPLKPSEEHLPIEVAAGSPMPEIGEVIYLVPRHVCPTVNNFDHALFVSRGEIQGTASVAARGHEGPLLDPQEITPLRTA